MPKAGKMKGRFTLEERKQAVARVGMETKKEICRSLGISYSTLTNWCFDLGAEKTDAQRRRERIGSIHDFVKKVRSVLWTTDKDQYESWQARVAQFEQMGYTKPQAQVRAAKDFTKLHPYFREYDIKIYDRDRGSHPAVVFYGDEEQAKKIVCLDQEMSYRDNLRWAASAAGKHLRTGEEFYEIPNDTAYYLYQQALGDPKDFISKLGTIEGREDMESMLEKTTRKMADKAKSEIDKWLSEVDRKVQRDGEEKEKISKVRNQGLFNGITPQRQEPADDVDM